MKQKLSWMLVIVVSMVLGASLVVGIDSLRSDNNDSNNSTAAVVQGSAATNSSSSTVSDNLSGVADLFAKVRPSIVQINGVNTRTQTSGLGSGIILDKQGNILTNNHVVDGFDQLDVSLADGTSASAKVVGTDPGNDLAVIHVDLPADKLVPATLADSSKVVAGQFVIAVGNPFGIEGSVTEGIVSGIGRTLSGGTGRPLRQLIQSDAAINPGNSGGALFNASGEVIGITTAIENPSGDRVFVGIGYAVPINTAKRYLPDLLAGKAIQHPKLGVVLKPVTPALATSLNLKVESGLMVIQIDANSAAARAGIKAAARTGVAGDVITRIDDEEIKTFDDLVNYIDSKKVGDKVTVTVNRDGQELKVDISLDAWQQGSSS